MMQGCGKRERIDSIAARMLRRHIEATVWPRVFHAAVNDANRTGYFGAARLAFLLKEGARGAVPGPRKKRSFLSRRRRHRPRRRHWSLGRRGPRCGLAG